MPREISKSPAYVIGFVAVISAIFTFAIMALHVASQGRVRANEKLLTEKAIVELFALGDVARMNGDEIASVVHRRIAGYVDPDAPAGDTRRAPILLHDSVSGTAIPLLVAFHEDLVADQPPPIHDRERVKGYAFPIAGQGFWDVITGWVALDPELTETLGIVFLRHSETPGLGGRITEAEFRDQFRAATRANGRGLVLATEAETPARIVIDHDRLAPGDPGYAQHVVAITGATGTSHAVATFLNEGLVRFYRAAREAGLWTDPREGSDAGGKR